ncbi:unnamed protein product [Bursaphelenchus okinawaensis]|uniref:OCEL domain-containing protein n=1 Tax=Bursaphelenchus okinawaensis TaxID=465554 RepID=A0A811KU95_9BILA|nr:unnamed protein product [Bursaphelenchus okinawaensis]CAG9113324.1 unnamed protein product [Bursaphelenchus okinawaensis]
MKRSNVSTASGQESLVVGRFGSDSQTSSKSIVLKLTDECNQAIGRAVEMGWPVRVVSTKTGITIEVGVSDTSVATFTCNQQRLNGNIDAVNQENATSFQNVSSLKTKLVVNATDKSFADTRQKVVKLVELQSQKQTKTTDTKTTSNSRKRAANAGNDNVFAMPMGPAPKKARHPARTATRRKVASRNVDHNVLRTVAQPKQKVVNSEVSQKSVNCVVQSKQNATTPRSEVGSHSNSKVQNVVNSTQNVLKSVNKEKKVDSDAKTKVVTPEAEPKTVNSNSKPKPGALTSEITCTTNWLAAFPEVVDAKKCARYTQLFESAYPSYIKSNERLAKVYQEFAELKKRYESAELDDKIETGQKLHELHERYESDADFYKCRKEHLMLHFKLETLRTRISEWKEKQAQ